MVEDVLEVAIRLLYLVQNASLSQLCQLHVIVKFGKTLNGRNTNTGIINIIHKSNRTPLSSGDNDLGASK